MRHRGTTLLLSAPLWLLVAACETSTPPSGGPGGGEAGQGASYPWAGGNTSDFGGQCAVCEAPHLRDVGLDDATLGFSGAEVLAVLEGVHVGEARWRDPCAPTSDGCSALDQGCPREAPQFAGSATELRVEVRHAGEGATVETCPAAEDRSYCQGRMLHLPIEVEISTADGLLAASESMDLIVTPGDELGLGGVPTAETMTGSLPGLLPEMTYVEWTMWFGPDGPKADIYVLGTMREYHSDNLLQLDGTDDADCGHYIELARAD